MLAFLSMALTLAACGGGSDGGAPAGTVATPVITLPAADPTHLPPTAPSPGPAVDPAPTDPAPAPEPAPEPTPSPAPAPAGTGPTESPTQLQPPVPATSSTVAALLLPAAGVVLDANAGAREDWAAAQARVRDVAAWAGWVASRRTLVDAWTARPRERADLLAGYMHDYVDAATGLPLVWTPDAAEPPAGATEQEQRFHRAWVFYLRDYNIRRLADAVGIFMATGEARYRDWAAAQLDFYATNYGLWPLRTSAGRGRLFQNGLDEATASFGLVDAARLLAPHVDPARADQWKQGLFLPMAENLKTTASPLTNIGLWHAAAVARIGMRYRDAALVAWGLDGSLGTRATLAASLGADNLWVEGSFSYNSYVVAALNGLCSAAALEGYGDGVGPERSALARLLLAPLDYRFDDGRLPTPGDAAPLPAIDAGTHASAYRSLPTWWGVQKARGQQTWETLVDPPPALPAEPALPATATRDFPANRMAVLRSGSWQVFVHYGQATANHAQQEAPGYELYHGSTPLSTDSGTVSYGSPYHADWFTRGASHNVPLVDGQGQQAWAAGTVTRFDAALHRLDVTHTGYRAGVDVSRSLQALPNGFTETTTLRSGGGSLARLGAAFHSACTLTPLAGLSAATDSPRPPANAATAYWGEPMAYSAAGSWALRLSCGAARYRYAVQGPAGQRVYLGRAATTPLPATRGFVYYEVTSAQAQFTVTISAE